MFIRRSFVFCCFFLYMVPSNTKWLPLFHYSLFNVSLEIVFCTWSHQIRNIFLYFIIVYLMFLRRSFFRIQITLNRSIQIINWSLAGTSSLGQCETGSNSNQGVLHTLPYLKNCSLTIIWSLVSFPDPLFCQGYIQHILTLVNRIKIFYVTK